MGDEMLMECDKESTFASRPYRHCIHPPPKPELCASSFYQYAHWYLNHVQNKCNHHGCELAGTWDWILGTEHPHTKLLTLSFSIMLFNWLHVFKHNPRDKT